jgi:hypothetical protein
MPRTARMTDALRGRGKALVFAGAAAALVGAGTASAATVATTAASPTVISSMASTQARALDAASSQGTASLALPVPAASHNAVAAPAQTQRPAAHAQLASTSQAAAPHAAAPATHAAAPAAPYEIYDSVTPSQIPAGHEVATYADGGYAVSPSQVAGQHVLWIDTNGSDPKAAALDVEPGDATPAGAAAWAKAKLTADPDGTAIIYTMRSDWAAAKAAVSSLPGSMPAHVQWWIADPTGVPHIVPGASATQWYWGSNYDITTASPGFWTAR